MALLGKVSLQELCCFYVGGFLVLFEEGDEDVLLAEKDVPKKTIKGVF